MFASGVRLPHQSHISSTPTSSLIVAPEVLAAFDAMVDHQIRIAILKEGSPSCGSSYSYDGSFKSVRLPLPGVTTAALEEAGVRVFSEHQLDAAAAFLVTLDQ